MGKSNLLVSNALGLGSGDVELPKSNFGLDATSAKARARPQAAAKSLVSENTRIELSHYDANQTLCNIRLSALDVIIRKSILTTITIQRYINQRFEPGNKLQLHHIYKNPKLMTRTACSKLSAAFRLDTSLPSPKTRWLLKEDSDTFYSLFVHDYCNR